MEFLKIAFTAFQLFVAALFVLIFLRFVFPGNESGWVDRALKAMLNTVNVSPEIVAATWNLTTSLAYLSGMLLVVFLLLVGAFLFGYTAATEFGYVNELLASYYVPLSRIASSPVAWAGATTAVGCTVAIGHMKNLNMQREKTRLDFIKHEREEHEARERQRMERLGLHRGEG